MSDEQRPNILFILTDDLGWGDVGFHGSPIRTPNLDDLASQSVELAQHYVCPVCTPTRTCFMTGRHPGRFGRHATHPSNAPVMPDGYESIAVSLRNAGYATGLFGKWHLGSSPEFNPHNYGFDASYGSLAGGVDPYNHCYKRGEFSKTWHRNGERVDERGHVTDLIVREAVEWIEGRAGPWFCYVPFTAVHTPIKPPQQWLARYAGEAFDEDPDKDRSFAKYAAYTSHMDWAVGELLEVLHRRCEREETLVVFASDNGAAWESMKDPLNYPGHQTGYPRLGSNLPYRGHKGQMYEGGIRTPTLVHWPTVLEPGKVSGAMHMVDWMPTLTKLVGYTPAEDPQWDGVDAWDLIRGERPDLGDRPLYWNLNHNRFAVRQGDWKLIVRENKEPREEELYNIAADPYEEQDVAAENAETVTRLSEVLAAQRKDDDASRRPDVPDNATLMNPGMKKPAAAAY